jgi:phosphoglycerol transferase MdoB-like AlkP superfamily enzyme
VTPRQILGWVDFATLLASIVAQPIAGWVALLVVRKIRGDRELAPAWHRSTLWAAMAPLLFLPTFLCVGFYVWVDLRRSHLRRRFFRLFFALLAGVLSLVAALIPISLVGWLVESALSR